MAVIEVFADVRCPFAHVALRRIVERRPAQGTGPALRIRAWPLELVDGEPMDVDLVDEEVRALREQVAPELFAGFSKAGFPATSLPALALTAAAYDQDLQSGEAVGLALRTALFEDGRDIAAPDVLGDLARSFGIPWAEGDARDLVLKEWREGRGRGVFGSPHLFANGGSWFCPALDISRHDGGFRITETPAALDDVFQRASALI